MQLDLIADMETFASRAKARRKELALTQAEVARASGLKQSDVSKIENGAIQKTTEMIGLAKALQCNPLWLAYGQGEMVVSISAEASERSPSAMQLAYAFDLIPLSKPMARLKALQQTLTILMEAAEAAGALQPAPDRKQGTPIGPA